MGSWQECAQLCAELRNKAGNKPCFSWTFNSGAADSLGLGAGVCRLLPYENVFRYYSISGLIFSPRPRVQGWSHGCPVRVPQVLGCLPDLQSLIERIFRKASGKNLHKIDTHGAPGDGYLLRVVEGKYVFTHTRNQELSFQQ